jgi:hypothetical protein
MCKSCARVACCSESIQTIYFQIYIEIFHLYKPILSPLRLPISPSGLFAESSTISLLSIASVDLPAHDSDFGRYIRGNGSEVPDSGTLLTHSILSHGFSRERNDLVQKMAQMVAATGDVHASLLCSERASWFLQLEFSECPATGTMPVSPAPVRRSASQHGEQKALRLPAMRQRGPCDRRQRQTENRVE